MRESEQIDEGTFGGMISDRNPITDCSNTAQRLATRRLRSAKLARRYASRFYFDRAEALANAKTTQAPARSTAHWAILNVIRLFPSY
jgi:hypothetical protein